jgi:hypothetical protein
MKDLTLTFPVTLRDEDEGKNLLPVVSAAHPFFAGAVPEYLIFP